MLDHTAVQQLQETLRRSIDNNEIAGGNLMLIKDGSEIFYHEDGLANRETGTPIARDSIFRLYSFTKPITATAVMILLERGDIDLLEPVSQYIPGFRNQMVEDGGRLIPVERDVTIHDLLTMTSGLVYGGASQAGQATEALFREIDQRLFGDSPMGTLEFINRLGEGPLASQPGSAWHYGTSADVLGAVVEVVTGMRFGTFLRKELFEPLGMKDTGFWVSEASRGRLVTTYENDGQGGLTPYTGHHLGINNRMDREPAFESGGAGLVSTIDDAARFTTMLLGKGSIGGVRILRPRTVEYLTSATLTTRQQTNFESWHRLRGHSYGNLMRVMTEPSQAGMIGSTGEYGWDGWLGAYFGNFPQESFTILFMANRKDAGTMPVTRKLRNIAVSSLF